MKGPRAAEIFPPFEEWVDDCYPEMRDHYNEERANKEGGRRSDPGLAHCDGCDQPQSEVALVEFQREEGGEWHRARWCLDCREAADASTAPGGAWVGETVHALRAPLVCPNCEAEPNIGFRFLEDASLMRGELEFRDDEAFDCDGYYRVDDENTTNERLQCGACLHEFPIPEWVEIEWK